MIHLILLLGMMQNNVAIPLSNSPDIQMDADYNCVRRTDGRWLCSTKEIPKEEIPDPIDVPAIEEKQKVLEHAKGSGWACGFDWCTAHEDSYTTETVTTCKDRSRILLHSEDGKYYCHKPQTE